MYCTLRHIILPALFFLSFNLPAQNLTGTWEGDLGSDQFLQLNILQTGNKICGYTADHVKADSTSFCKAFFEGYFDTKRKRLIINGKYFLKNSGSHYLMQLKLKLKKDKSVDVLHQEPFIKILYREYRSFSGIIVSEPYIGYDSTEYVHLKKVSDQPYELIDLMNDCIARDKKVTDTAAKKTTSKPADSLPPMVKIPVPEKPTDSLPPVISQVPAKKDSIATPIKIPQRKNVEQSHLEVNVKTINLKVYDNAIVDGDTVSIL